MHRRRPTHAISSHTTRDYSTAWRITRVRYERAGGDFVLKVFVDACRGEAIRELPTRSGTQPTR